MKQAGVAGTTLLFLAVFTPFFASAAPSTSSGQATCATLSRGSTGPSVTAVQQVLYKAYKEFPSPTGFFGPTTEAALKQWQSEHNLVSSGTPATTGYGSTGPRTRAAIAACR